MTEKLILGAEEEAPLGALELFSVSPNTPFAVVFEDEGDTGYFYALDQRREDNPIVDALHIYDVAAVSDGHIPSKFQIIWTSDGLKAALFINNYPHAVFDFENRHAYCRNAFPPPAVDGFFVGSNEWDDAALELFGLDPAEWG